MLYVDIINVINSLVAKELNGIYSDEGYVRDKNSNLVSYTDHVVLHDGEVIEVMIGIVNYKRGTNTLVKIGIPKDPSDPDYNPVNDANRILELIKENMVTAYQPLKGEKLLRLGGNLDKVEVVEYVRLYDYPGFQLAHQVEHNHTHPSGRYCYTPQPGHLFTMKGIDIHTGEMSTNQLILDWVRSKE